MLVKIALALCFYLGRLTMDKTVEESHKRPAFNVLLYFFSVEERKSLKDL